MGLVKMENMAGGGLVCSGAWSHIELALEMDFKDKKAALKKISIAILHLEAEGGLFFLIQTDWHLRKENRDRF